MPIWTFCQRFRWPSLPVCGPARLSVSIGPKFTSTEASSKSQRAKQRLGNAGLLPSNRTLKHGYSLCGEQAALLYQQTGGTDGSSFGIVLICANGREMWRAIPSFHIITKHLVMRI